MRKHCNSNDVNSIFEQAAGELRAKLMGGGGAWPAIETTHQSTPQQRRCRRCGGRRRDLPQCRWAVAGLAGQRGDAPSEARSADGSRAAGPSGARNTSGATSTPARQRTTRRPEIYRGNKPPTPRRHNKTARPQWGRAAVAVALGFEPRVAVTPHSISSAAPSAARTRYLTRILYYTLPLRTQIDRAGWEQGHTAAWEHGHTATRSTRSARNGSDLGI